MDSAKEAYTIGDVTDEAIFTIDCAKGSVDFPIIVVSRASNYIDVEPIKYNDKVVSLKRMPNIDYRVKASIGARPLTFNIKSVQYIVNDNNMVVHRLICHDSVKPKNYRSYKRFSICVDGTVQLGAHHKAVKCTLRDISYGGIQIVIHGKESVNINEQLSLHFIYTCMNKLQTNVSVPCIPVRVVYNEESDETIIGIKIKGFNRGVTDVVNDIQRAELSKLKHVR